jgi:hypothetical protein
MLSTAAAPSRGQAFIKRREIYEKANRAHHLDELASDRLWLDPSVS